MKESGTPSNETERRIRHALLRPLAAVAILASLTACSPGEKQVSPSQPTANRNAPPTEPYSRDVDPQYYADIAAAHDYVPAGAATDRLNELQKQAIADWLPADAWQATSDIRTVLEKSTVDHTVPVFVSYAIPNRDLGGQSAGGLDATTYDEYISAISDAIGQKNAVVILEPDAVPQLIDMQNDPDGAMRNERINLLASALDTLHSNRNTAVYLDAGNSTWHDPSSIAGYLRQIDARSATGIPGISLNVSNFQSDAATTAYGEQLEAAYGKQLYLMIDAARNGDPRAAAFTGSDPWCNPPEQYLGQADAVFDARKKIEELYIKTPGESDGSCNESDKPAGEFDGKLLSDLLQR